MMNSFLRKMSRHSSMCSALKLKNIINCNVRQFCINDNRIELFAVKNVSAAKGSGTGNKVANISSKKQSLPPAKKVEEEKPAKKTAASKKQVASKKKSEATKTPQKRKKSQAEDIESEETLEEVEEPQPEIKKNKKAPQKAAHTLNTEPLKKEKEETSIETETVKTSKKKKAEEKTEPASKVKKTKVAKSSTEFPSVDLSDPKSIGVLQFNADLDFTRYTSNPDGLFLDYINQKSSPTTKEIINKENQYLCNNYAPLPVVLAKGQGVYLQDIDGKMYLDFLASYSASNQGHCHKTITEKVSQQMNNLDITSRAFYNNVVGIAAKYVCDIFKYEKVLFMNTGVEAVESSIKIARKWGYTKKNIPQDQAKVVFAKGNFMGRTIFVCGVSDDPTRYENFGPYDRTSHYLVEFNKIEALKEVLEKDSNICAVLLEPIQGENGIIIPSSGYLTEVAKLCKKHNVLFIADEIQSGCGRTGFPLYINSEAIIADMVLLGKSLSAGVYPVSAVLASKEIMDVIKPGDHGSTFGGNPVAAYASMWALNQLMGEGMISNSFHRGIEFGLCLKDLEKNNIVKEIRGRGLMYGIEIWPDCGLNAYDVSLWLMERGILAKPTKKHILRLTPPLVVTREQVERAADTIISVFEKADKKLKYTAPEPVKFNLIDVDIPEAKAFTEYRQKKKLEFKPEPAVNMNLFNIPEIPTIQPYSQTPIDIIKQNLSNETISFPNPIQPIRLSSPMQSVPSPFDNFNTPKH